MNPETKLFINRELVDAASGKTYDNINPATEEVMGQVADAGPEDMERAIAAANAGMARPNKVENLVEEEVMVQVNTNFVGTALCCQAVIPLLRSGENPRIVNISSASSWHYDEISHLSIYAATKAAVERFTRDLRLEVQHDGIGVTCVRPSDAITDFSEGWEPEAFTAALEGWKDMGTYMDMGMEASDVAGAVCYSLSQRPGVAVDLLEVRPNVPTSKAIF